MPYTLKAVSAYLGVPPDTVRKWEARHAVVRPRRLPNGYREYLEEDLQTLLRFSRERGGGRPGAEAARRAASAPPPPDFRRERAAAMKAAQSFDRTALERLFSPAARKRGAPHAVRALWLPVLQEIGARAHAGGALWIAVEHFTTAFLREAVLRTLAGSRRGAPVLALFAPSGERHELGMLAAACALEEAGVATLYLGADLPAESFLAAARRLRLKAAALALTADAPRASVKSLLTLLRRRAPRLKVFVCGRGSLRHANLVRDCGAVFIGADMALGTERIRAALADGGAA